MNLGNKHCVLLLALWMGAAVGPAAADTAAPALGVVGGNSITQASVEADLAFAPKENLPDLFGTTKRFKDYVADLAYAYARIGAAEQAGLTKSDEYQRELEQFKRRLAIKLWQRSVEQPIDEGAVRQEAQRYYDAHPEEFSLQGQLHLAAFRVTLAEGAAASVIQAKRDIAAKAQGLLKGGTDFFAVAQQLSDDPAVLRRNADLGWVDPGSLDPATAKALASAKAGEVSGIVDEKDGIAIYKVLETGAAGAKVPFAEVQVALFKRFEAEARVKESKRQREVVDKSFPVRLNDEAIEQYRQERLKALPQRSGS